MKIKFKIERASPGKKKPCKEAIMENGNWFIYFSSFEELLLFIEKYERIIIESISYNKELGCKEQHIIIYDYYIE